METVFLIEGARLRGPVAKRGMSNVPFEKRGQHGSYKKTDPSEPLSAQAGFAGAPCPICFAGVAAARQTVPELFKDR